MKKIYKILIALSVVFSLAAFVACDNNGNGETNEVSPNVSTSLPTSEPETPSTSDEPEVPSTSDEPEAPSTSGEPEEEPLKEITGVTFGNASYVYDGEEKGVFIQGELPKGVTCVYTNNKGTDAGVYNAKAVLSGKGYETKTLTTTLIIEKADITGIAFSSNSVEYDTYGHSLQVVGNVPDGVYVTYMYNGEEVLEVSEVGSYNVSVVLEGKNYNKLILTATLKITSTEEQLYGVSYNGTVYFQNNLDSNKLYKVNGSNIAKVNNDIPQYMVSDGKSIYYYSYSLLSKTIKAYDGSGATQLFSVSGEYLATDGQYIYYAVNNFLINTDQNGIYRINLNGKDEAATRLTTDKASYLCCVDGYVYYANGSNGNKLSRISTSAVEGQSEVLWEEKTSYIIEDDGVIYFDSEITLGGSAIYKYIISSGNFVKLTTDSGKYLTKVGSYIYYVNNDLLTSTFFGDGIYRVSVNRMENSLPGEKVLSATDNGYSSLMSDGENLYYYKLNDKHFYVYNVKNGTEIDLMKNFVPVDDTVISGEAKIKEYGGELYYTNPLDSSCLYKYNPKTKQRTKVLSESVADVWFNDGYMYYSTYVLTNYALWKMDLKTHETVKITSSRCENLIFEGDAIYYIQITPFTTNNKIMKMEADGTITQIYNMESPSVTGMEKMGDTFYFVRNPTIGKQYLCSYTLGEKDDVVTSERAIEMVIYGNKYYYYDASSYAFKTCDLDGKNAKTLKANVDMNEMYLLGNILYYSSVKDGTKGIYAYNLQTETEVKIFDKVGEGMVMLDGKLYFLQTSVYYDDLEYPVHNGNGDAFLYCYDGSSVKKVA